MRKIREILRLRFEIGLSFRQIAAEEVEYPIASYPA